MAQQEKAVGSNRETGAQMGMLSNHLEGEAGNHQVYNPATKGLILYLGPLLEISLVGTAEKAVRTNRETGDQMGMQSNHLEELMRRL